MVFCCNVTFIKMAPFRWKYAIVCFSFCLKLSLGALDINAVLLDCEKDSSKNDLTRITPPYHTIDNCNRKVRISLNITNIGKTPPDLDYSFLSQLPDAVNGINMFLLHPIVLRLKQDQVILAYPFHYLSAVNGKATEVVVNYENRQNFTGCDDTSQVNPTCGVKHDKGTSVPYSEGFCCFCPEMLVNEKQIRGGQDCSLDVGDPADIEKQKFKASAHCLVFNDVWYTVSALSEPVIIHETYMQVYNQRHFKNGSSAWVALTHDEDFELGYQNPYQYDENKTILISYLTSAPKDTSVTIPVDERRLFTPQPMPAVELLKLPTQVKRGASDYLLIPEVQINPYGRECDVSGVSYEAFAKQNDRCNVPKDTCLKNQPLDFWEMDDEKRKAGAKGSYLLENYGTPYKEPIIVDPKTKEHWLAMEYHEQHATVLSIEINADEIAIMTEGKRAQISKIASSNTKQSIDIHVTVLNSGLMPAEFQVQVVKCAFEVPDSNAELIVIPPQLAQDVVLSTKPGAITLDEKFSCDVQVSNDLYGIVAKRNVEINPGDRCICTFHCECSCLDGDLKCEPMSEKDYHAAGFQGSLPILTAKPPYKPWILKHPYLAFLAFILLLLLTGFIKGICGLAGLQCFGYFGLEKFLYRPKVIRNYFDFGLKEYKVVYDEEGYPIHPHTKEHVKVICEEILFALNVCFFFLWPFIKIQDVIAKQVAKRKIKQGAQVDEYSSRQFFSTDGMTSPYDGTCDAEKGQAKKIGKHSSESHRLNHNNTHQPAPGKERFGTTSPYDDTCDAEKGQAKKIGKHSSESQHQLSHSNTHQPASGKERFMKYQKPKTLISDSISEAQLTGPIADPLNKELERWRKGTTRINAFRKRN